MQNSLQQKRNDFAISIRKEQRKKIIQEKRIKYFNLLPEQINEIDFIQHFELANHPNLSKQKLKNNPFILVDVLLAKSENLIRVSFKNNEISSKIDEKLSPPPESQFELEDVPLPTQYPFRLQTAIYDSLSSDIYQNPGKYRKLQKKVQQDLITFWLKFLKRNKYTQTARQKEYHLSIIYFLLLFVCEIQSPDLRERILIWVQGPQSLELIFNCLSGNFVNYHKYVRIYEIILKGFKCKDVKKRMEAVDVMVKCIRMSDYDDIATLLEHRPELFLVLLDYLNDEHILESMYQNSEYLHSMRKAAFCLNFFLSTYDQGIFQCLRAGAGFAGARLICEKDPELIKQGIQIFNIVASIQDEQYSRKALKFLISNPSIICTNVWGKLGLSYEIVKHNDMQIKKAFISLIHTFLSNAEFHEIISLNSQFKFPNEEGLVDILIVMFLENNDSVMQKDILACFHSFFYYFQNVVEDNLMEMDLWNNQHGNDSVQSISTNFIVEKIYSSGMVKMLQEIQNIQQQTSPIPQDLKESVSLTLQFIDRFKPL